MDVTRSNPEASKAILGDEPTEAIFLTKTQFDVLIIALNDSTVASKERIKYVENQKDFDLLTSKEELEEIKALSQFQLENIPEVLEEIKEIYPTFDEEKKPKIPPPTWRS